MAITTLFERVLAEAPEKHPMRVLACCVLPNHWHFVLWPACDGPPDGVYELGVTEGHVNS